MIKKIICILNLIIPFFCIAQNDSRLRTVEDLSGNGARDRIELRYENETFYLRINSDSIDLKSSA